MQLWLPESRPGVSDLEGVHLRPDDNFHYTIKLHAVAANFYDELVPSMRLST